MRKGGFETPILELSSILTMSSSHEKWNLNNAYNLHIEKKTWGLFEIVPLNCCIKSARQIAPLCNTQD